MENRRKPALQSLSNNNGVLDKDVYATLEDRTGSMVAEIHCYHAGFFRFNWHSSLDISLVLQGNLTLYTEDGVYEMAEDDFQIINSNVGHAGLAADPDTCCCVLLISREYLQQILGHDAIFRKRSGAGNPAAERMIRGGILQMYGLLVGTSSASAGSTQKTPDPAARIAAGAYLRQILAVLIKEYMAASISDSDIRNHTRDHQEIQSIIRYIDHHFRDDISLHDVAVFAGMNDSYCSTFIRSQIGIGFHDYLSRKRLEYAIFMLNNTDHNILDISMDAGFPNVKSFNAVFRKYLNLTPGSYRRQISRNGKYYLGSSSVIPYTNSLVQTKQKEYLEQLPDAAEQLALFLH